MLNQEALDNICYELEDRGVTLESILEVVNDDDHLSDFLSMIGHGDLAIMVTKIYQQPKILVIGDCKVEVDTLRETCRNMGFSEDRFDFVLGYKKASKYNFEQLRYNDTYALVIFGALAHSTRGKRSYSSIIEAMRRQPECFPQVLVATVREGTIKMTNTNFKEALVQAVTNDMVIPDDWDAFHDALIEQVSCAA